MYSNHNELNENQTEKAESQINTQLIQDDNNNLYQHIFHQNNDHNKYNDNNKFIHKFNTLLTIKDNTAIGNISKVSTSSSICFFLYFYYQPDILVET